VVFDVVLPEVVLLPVVLPDVPLLPVELLLVVLSEAPPPPPLEQAARATRHTEDARRKAPFRPVSMKCP